MHSLVFFPAAAGEHEVTREARVLSLAIQTYSAALAVGEMFSTADKSLTAEEFEDYCEEVFARIGKRLVNHVMQLYPSDPANSDINGFKEICDLAETFGLNGELPKGVIQ